MDHLWLVHCWIQCRASRRVYSEVCFTLQFEHCLRVCLFRAVSVDLCRSSILWRQFSFGCSRIDRSQEPHWGCRELHLCGKYCWVHRRGPAGRLHFDELFLAVRDLIAASDRRHFVFNGGARKMPGTIVVCSADLMERSNMKASSSIWPPRCDTG